MSATKPYFEKVIYTPAHQSLVAWDQHPFRIVNITAGKMWNG
jgi:hypothetical protein